MSETAGKDVRRIMRQARGTLASAYRATCKVPLPECGALLASYAVERGFAEAPKPVLATTLKAWARGQRGDNAGPRQAQGVMPGWAARAAGELALAAGWRPQEPEEWAAVAWLWLAHNPLRSDAEAALAMFPAALDRQALRPWVEAYMRDVPRPEDVRVSACESFEAVPGCWVTELRGTDGKVAGYCVTDEGGAVVDPGPYPTKEAAVAAAKARAERADGIRDLDLARQIDEYTHGSTARRTTGVKR